MIINEKLINDIFNLKIKLKKKDKDKLSKYQELIPMYDIYSQEIYPIKKKNLHYRLIETDYRFINNEIYDWLKNLYIKYKNNKELSNKLKRNLDIIANYNIEILIETSYKTLYEYSPKLGLLVSICKRESFDPFMKHLKPYYTKLELIKLGQNMNLIKTEIDIEKLLNQEFHYEVCKKIRNNDVSFDEIKDHTNFIIDNDIISYICFYSFFGSFLYNKHLRDKNIVINKFLYDGINKIVNVLNKSPKLNNDYYLYRFIWDDCFLKDIKIDDYFIDTGFISCTRDPFYSPGINGNFGLTLLKIHIPKNILNIGLFIENFSLFPKEEEFLLQPNTKFKLISKDDNFKYYHTNETFEKLISKKYEFKFVDSSKIDNINIKNNIKIIKDLKTYEIHGYDRITMLKSFISESNQINITINKKNYLLICLFFDSTSESPYNKLYYNKIKDGLLISLYDNGYPYLNLELGKELVVNYINQFYFYKNDKQELNQDLIDIILEIGRIFSYKEAKIFHNYKNFSEFANNYTESNQIFLFNNFYNHTLYDYSKNKIKFLNYKFIKNNIGWYYIDELLDSKLINEIKIKFRLKTNNIREELINIIENNFSIYEKFINEVKELEEINKNNYLIFQIYERLNYENRINNFKSDMLYENNQELGEEYQLIFQQPIRRY
jgi:hypothetical protein